MYNPSPEVLGTADYTFILEECRDAVERHYDNQSELLASRWEVGKAICEGGEYRDEEGLLARLSRDMDLGIPELHHCTRFFERCPGEAFYIIVSNLPWAENSSWSMVKTLLPPANDTTLLRMPSSCEELFGELVPMRRAS